MKHVSQIWGKMSKEQKEHYKVLSDSDRRRFDTEKKLVVKRKPKKRELKEEEKKQRLKDPDNEYEELLEIDSKVKAIKSANFTLDISSNNSALSSGLNFQNVAEAYISEKGVFTTAASTSSGRIRSLEQANDDDDNYSMSHSNQMLTTDDSSAKYKQQVQMMGLMSNQNIDSYNLNSVNQKEQHDL